ncbi:pilS cassette [Neisseria chenwenguii]|nr:pilS cassette [Neisseria chenwenguii]
MLQATSFPRRRESTVKNRQYLVLTQFQKIKRGFPPARE